MQVTPASRLNALQKLSAAPASALFVGPRGAGKTKAAQDIAAERGVDLRRIDLGQVVSPHIGETEKNIDRLFEAAEREGAVLVFTEADALFGKRSEVRDAHDRYANIDVNYLLAKIEAHQGLAIVAATSLEALDPAIVRRLGAVIDFPSPPDPDA